MIRKTVATMIFCTMLLGATNAKAGEFEQFVIAPQTQGFNGFRGAIYFGDYLKQNPAIPCKWKKLAPTQLQVIDQEGGIVARLDDTRSMPPLQATAVAQGIDTFRAGVTRASKAIASRCISVNLAPVADTNYMPNSANRAYSLDPATANLYAAAFSEALRGAGVIPTWKHFPSYTSKVRPLPATSSTYRQWYKPHFVEPSIDFSSPDELTQAMQAFKSNDRAFLMVNNGFFTALNTPAIFSPYVVEMAHKTQPNSLLITDDISELALDYTKIKFIFKSYDLFLFSSEQDAQGFVNALNELALSGEITEQDIKTKEKRVVNLIGKF